MRSINFDGGADEIVLAGTDDGGSAFVEVYQLDGTLLNRRLLGSSLEVVDLAPVLVDGYPALAVLTTKPDSGPVYVFVLDENLEKVRTLRYPTATTSAIATIGATVVVAMRIESTGSVRVDARDAASGALVWKRTAAPGFDPASMASMASGDGTIWVVSHRMGDGTALIHERTADTGAIVGRTFLP